MHEIVANILKTVLHNQNQFASGGLLLMAIGALGASLRKIPGQIVGCIMRQTTMSMEILDDSSSFTWFKYWFQSHHKSTKIRRIDAYTPYIGNETAIFVAPSVGSHWIWYKGRPLRISLIRSEEKKTFSHRRAESFLIETIGRDQKFLREFLNDIYSTYASMSKTKPALCVFDGKEWNEVPGYSPRTLESVILPNDQKNALVRDISQFLSSKEWYQSKGIPYKRGYLLHGLPGTGKTSVINGLSCHFKMSVSVLNLNEISDGEFMKAMLSVPSHSIVLLEDIDCAVSGRQAIASAKPADLKEEDKLGKNVTLSGLLNVLDGVQTPQGVLFFMTTNNINSLDAAILRAGRCDVKIYFGEATPSQKIELYRRFFPKDDSQAARRFVQSNITSTMSEFQEVLLQNINSRLEYDVLEMSAD